MPETNPLFDSETELLSVEAIGVTAATTSPAVNTNKSSYMGRPEALVVLDVTVLTGSALAVDFKLVGTVNGVDFDVPSGGFTQITATGVAREVISVPVLPLNVKVIYEVAGTTPALTATINCLRV